MARQKHNKVKEQVRNTLFVLLAAAVVVIFFNLDVMHKGESVFSKQGKTKLYFHGDLKREAYTKSEIDRLYKFLKSHAKIMESATVETRLQDSYRKVTDRSQVTFEVHLVMTDGTRISTSARRSTRGSLISSVLAKLDKDVRAYRKLKKDGKKMKTLINTS